MDQAVPLEVVAGEQDHYVEHLAEVNEHNDVVSSEDICNKQGVLLVRKGSRINHEQAQRILNHKLLRPLEEQIRLENTVGTEDLLQHCRAVFAKYPDLGHIHEALDFNAGLKGCLVGVKLSAILMQKLTVLRERLPEEYEKSLFCAWLSALIAREVGLDNGLMHVTFLAGLAHDVGLMHIAPAILNKQGVLEAAQWRAIQSHVVIGQLLLKNMPGIDPRAARAVLEHHERCDGSGYPAGKTEEQLDILGQIVGIADSLQAIRMNQFAESGRNLRDALPYLQMNINTHFYPVYRAMCGILQKAGLERTCVNSFDNVSSLVLHLLKRGTMLKGTVALLEHVLEIIPSLPDGRGLAKLTKVVTPVLAMIRASGLVRDEIFVWLETLPPHPEQGCVEELVDIELMQNELCWQLKKVARATGEYLDKQGAAIDARHCEQLRNIAGTIPGFLAA